METFRKRLERRAAPTTGFVVSIVALVVVGMFKLMMFTGIWSMNPEGFESVAKLFNTLALVVMGLSAFDLLLSERIHKILGKILKLVIGFGIILTAIAALVL